MSKQFPPDERGLVQSRHGVTGRRWLLKRSWRIAGPGAEWWLGGALLLWGLAPIFYLLLRAHGRGETLSGAVSIFAGDQLQYLAWIRGSGEHVLAANAFDLGASGHDFLQPMFLLSGVLWRIGVNIGLSYLLWLPVAAGTLFVGFWRFSQRLLGPGATQAAALALAVFFVSPVFAGLDWLGAGSSGLGVVAGELAPAGSLYGYFPTALAIGLTPLCLLGAERIVEMASTGASVPARWMVGTALAGAIAAWLHPWQGEILVLVMIAGAAWQRFAPPYRRLLVPVVAAAIPLLYYFALSRADSVWSMAQSQSVGAQPSLLLVLATLSPLLPFACWGARGWPDTLSARSLVLWPVAAVVVFLASPGYASHALRGLSLPIAVLAICGWKRLSLPVWLGAIAIAACTIPGLVRELQVFRDVARADPQAMLLRGDERRALASLAAARGGGVLASSRITTAIPAYTGHRTWIGHPSWTPGYASRYKLATSLLQAEFGAARTRSLARSIGARYWLVDCEPGALAPRLGQLVLKAQRFGCVTLYTLNIADHTAPL